MTTHFLQSDHNEGYWNNFISTSLETISGLAVQQFQLNHTNLLWVILLPHSRLSAWQGSKKGCCAMTSWWLTVWAICLAPKCLSALPFRRQSPSMLRAGGWGVKPWSASSWMWPIYSWLDAAMVTSTRPTQDQANKTADIPAVSTSRTQGAIVLRRERRGREGGRGPR